jgi:hypothetical protein
MDSPVTTNICFFIYRNKPISGISTCFFRQSYNFQDTFQLNLQLKSAEHLNLGL